MHIDKFLSYYGKTFREAIREFMSSDISSSIEPTSGGITYTGGGHKLYLGDRENPNFRAQCCFDGCPIPRYRAERIASNIGWKKILGSKTQRQEKTQSRT